MAKPEAQNLPVVWLFTDGACLGNPGPGGWAYILRDVRSGKEKRASGASASTTNNRMELTAVIEGLKALRRPCEVRLFTDSQYVSRGLQEWLPRWKQQGWARREDRRKAPLKNADLWKALDQLVRRHHVTCHFVRGHAGHPENEECDRMAHEAAARVAGTTRS
jgi:ribonuclease HI